VKGSSTPIGIIEVYDQDPSEIRHLKNQIGPIMSEGIALFKAGVLEAALSKFQEAQLISPEDTPIRLLISSLKKIVGQGEMTKPLLDFR
jgi:hypothetical protein